MGVCAHCKENSVVELSSGSSIQLYEQIKKLSAQGQEVHNNKTLLKNLIGDIFFNDAKLRTILRIAVEEGHVASKLVNLLSSGESYQLGINRIIAHLSDECGIDELRAAEAVRIIGLGFGLPHSAFTPQQGSVIKFGDHKWRVLEEKNGKILILSELTLETQGYHETEEAVTWAICTLREYLNGAFYDKFSHDEKSRIVEVKNRKLRNPWFYRQGISADAKDTNDKIFLLSIEDVVCYFGDSGQLCKGNPRSVDDFIGQWGSDINPDLKAALQAEKSNKGIWISDCFNKTRVAYDEEGNPAWWWLRSPGYFPSFAAIVSHDGRLFVVGQSADTESISDTVGVRPALWLKY